MHTTRLPTIDLHVLVAATRCQYQWGNRYTNPQDAYPSWDTYLQDTYAPQGTYPSWKGPGTRDTYPHIPTDRMTDGRL